MEHETWEAHNGQNRIGYLYFPRLRSNLLKKNEFPGHHNTMIDDTKTLETTNVKGVLLLSRNLHRDHKQDRDASFVDTIFILRQFCLINSCAHHELNTSEGYGPRSSLQVCSLILIALLP